MLLSRRQRRPLAVSAQMWLLALQSAFVSHDWLQPTAGLACTTVVVVTTVVVEGAVTVVTLTV